VTWEPLGADGKGSSRGQKTGSKCGGLDREGEIIEDSLTLQQYAAGRGDEIGLAPLKKHRKLHEEATRK